MEFLFPDRGTRSIPSDLAAELERCFQDTNFLAELNGALAEVITNSEAIALARRVGPAVLRTVVR